MSPQGLALWLNNSATPEEENRILEHLIHCAACREQMVMIRQATQPDAAITAGPEFDHLLRLAEQAAQDVWAQRLTSAPSVARPADAQPADAQTADAQTAEKPPWWEWFTLRRPAPRWAAAAVLLLAVFIPVYRFYQSDQPVERALASMRQAWPQNRPIEARITGAFPYRPYQVTRGGDASGSVNREQLLAATAELAREVADRPRPQARHALGRLHLLKAEFADAEEQLKLVIKEEPQNSLARVDLASVYYERGVREGASQLLFQAAEHLTKATESSPKLAEAWFNLALCHEKMLLFTQAKADWEQYLKLDADSQWANEARASLQKLRERSQMSAPQPSKLADELLAAEAAGDEGLIRDSLAENFTEVGTVTWDRLLDDYLAALSAGDRSKAESSGRALAHLAELIRATKDDAYFLDQFNYVRTLTAAQSGRVQEVRALLAQGEAAHQKGAYDKAVAFFSQALSAAERSGDVCHTEKAMYGLARTYTPQTETPRLAAIRRRLVSAASQRRHWQMKAKALLALANQHLAETKFSLLLETSSQAYEISRRIGDVDTSANSLRFTGNAYTGLGKTDNVFKSFFAALQILHSNYFIPLRGCQIYTQFAGALSERGNPQGALEYQLEALPYCRQYNDLLYASAQGRAWKYVVLTGQNEQSIRLFHNASFGAEKYNKTTGLNSMLFDLYISLGDAYLKQEQAGEAVSAYQNALKLRGQNRSFFSQSRIFHGLALAYLRQNENDEAEKALHKSVELAERARENISEIDNRSAFTASRNAVYQTMVDFQYSVKKSAGRAFDYAEIYRSRELFDLITQRKGLQWDTARMTLALADISTARTGSQIQRSLPANLQLVEYAFTEQRLLIWVVTAGGLETVSEPLDRAQLQTLVADYLAALRQREPVNSLNTKARQLYQLLIRPVEAYLSKDRALVFVPDGLLKALPFAALVSPASNRYLVEDYALAVSPSASILAQLIERHKERSRVEEPLLVVSNPRFSQKLFPGLRPLPGSDEELLNLRSFYPDMRQLSGEQATKKALLELMGQAAVVHLATHSFPDEEVPLSAAIVLAPNSADITAETKEASVLQAQEILQLKLPKTRLVILASCHSASSEQLNSPATLAQAFFSAGVPAVIGSLWEVEDASTARLMTAFYRAHRMDRLNPCQSLRQAQLTFLNATQGQWRHPYYWAAFLLNGHGAGY